MANCQHCPRHSRKLGIFERPGDRGDGAGRGLDTEVVLQGGVTGYGEWIWSAS